jgi:pimeloyl-ACP methyl ester carboxylesterase
MPEPASSSHRLEPLRHVDAGVLNVAYYEAGPADGPVVVLLHGFPYDIHSYVDVAPMLAAGGCRTIVPYLRGYGPTCFLDEKTPRSGEQAAMGADLIALMDALAVPRAVFAGYDWGGRAACVAAALWPERCIGLVSVNGYLVQDIAKAMVPVKPEREVPLWYQYYFQLERGRAGLAVNRRGIARILWRQWSPKLGFRRCDLRADGRGIRQSRLRRRRDSQLPSSLRSRRRRSAICRIAAPAGGAAGHHGPGHHLRWRRRRGHSCNRRHRVRAEIPRPPRPSCPAGRGA